MTIRFKNGKLYGFNISTEFHRKLKEQCGEGSLNVLIKGIISQYLYKKQNLLNIGGIEADMVNDKENHKMSASKYLEMVIKEYFENKK
jgi:hypothetical protein